MLRLHSGYFRKFLDSADKDDSKPNGQCKYDYVNVIVEGGAWGLESGGKVGLILLVPITPRA